MVVFVPQPDEAGGIGRVGAVADGHVPLVVVGRRPDGRTAGVGRIGEEARLADQQPVVLAAARQHRVARLARPHVHDAADVQRRRHLLRRPVVVSTVADIPLSCSWNDPVCVCVCVCVCMCVARVLATAFSSFSGPFMANQSPETFSSAKSCLCSFFLRKTQSINSLVSLRRVSVVIS